ncbi:MAG: hypothetical protein EAZ21_00415 [Betaproteobacteria bacterium]|nr:MAG: hypothetical protein EAZ21_00415 [Betaproteobacteria bacterium]
MRFDFFCEFTERAFEALTRDRFSKFALNLRNRAVNFSDLHIANGKTTRNHQAAARALQHFELHRVTQRILGRL